MKRSEQKAAVFLIFGAIMQGSPIPLARYFGFIFIVVALVVFWIDEHEHRCGIKREGLSS